MVNYFIAKDFLLGLKGDEIFQNEEDGRISYDIPWINYVTTTELKMVCSFV